MKILPPRTLPPATPIKRRHTPRATTGRYGYRAYRSCLRWEFAFTCAFCLLHEADFAEYGAEGLGLTSIEHFDPASRNATKINDYENCFYACCLCNGSRSDARVVDRESHRLLNPCTDAWADHFVMTTDDRLSPVDGDVDALRTAAIYDLNAPLKVKLRRWRRKHIEEWLGLVERGPDRVADLLARSARATTRTEAQALLEAAKLLHGCIVRASRDLAGYAAIPQDVDNSCRCGSTANHTLPVWFADQVLDLI